MCLLDYSLTTKSASEMLGIPIRDIREGISSGGIPFVKVLNSCKKIRHLQKYQYLLRKDDLLDWREKKQQKAEEKRLFPIEKVSKMYFEDNISIDKIAKDYNLNRGTLGYRIKKYNKGLKSFRESKLKYHCNESYFENVDTPEKAYWLGLIAADGCVYERKKGKILSISASTRNNEILYKFKKSIDSTHFITTTGEKLFTNKIRGKVYKKKEHNSLTISSAKMFNDLGRYGIVPRKSLKLEYPDLLEGLNRHFMRGYFDGDGCVYINKRNNISLIYCSGSLKLVEKMLFILEKEIGFNFKYSISSNKNENYHMFRIGSKENVLKLFYYLYKYVSSDVYLERKYNKIIDFFKKKGIKY